MRQQARLKSNTWVVFVPIVLWFAAAFAYVRYFQAGCEGQYDCLVAAGLSIPFFATALAQLRSGYLWQNNAPGNRGAHRSTCPLKFIISTAIHGMIGVAIATGFVLQYCNPR